MNRALHVLPAGIALGLAAAGCGASSGKTSPATNPAPLTQAPAGTKTAATAAGGAVSVEMRNIAFVPKTVTVPVGKKVFWVNEDNVQHNVTAKSGASFHSKNFGKGGHFEFTPTHPGTIHYVCTLHPGMDGTIVVKPPPKH